MRKVCASGLVLLVAAVGAGCSAPSSGPPPPSTPPDSVVLEIDGKVFQAGCADGASGGGFMQGATCGSTGPGSGPLFHSLSCNKFPATDPPVYFVGTAFHQASDLTAGTTIDLSQPGHEAIVTVMMNYMDETRTESHYCTAPPRDAGADGYPASSGTVTVRRFALEPEAPSGDYLSEVEVTNALVPSLDGGPAIKILEAHLYFE